MRAHEIIRRASHLLADTQFERWSEASLLDYLNEARLRVALARPDAAAVSEVVRLDPGTRQELPQGGARLLDVVRNMGPDGATPGESVRLADRETLDAVDGGWHAALGQGVVHHYLFDDRLPASYLVYPPASASPEVWLEIVYARTPAPLTSPVQAVGLPEAFGAPLADFVLHRAFAADAESAESLARSAAHLEAFERAVAGKLSADALVSPKTRSQSS